MAPRGIEDKDFDAKSWIFRGLQAIAAFLIIQFYYGTQEQQKLQVKQNDEIQKALYELKEEKAVQKQLNGFLIEGQNELKKKNERLESKLEDIERRISR